VASGDGTLFPDPSAEGAFKAIVCPAGAPASLANAEVIRCTARSGDSFGTIARAQMGTSARSVQVGDQVFLAQTREEIEAQRVFALVADQTLNSVTTLTDIPGMQFWALGTGTEIYEVQANLWLFTANSAMDGKFGWSIVGSPTGSWGWKDHASGAIQGFGPQAVASGPLALATLGTALSFGSPGGAEFGLEAKARIVNPSAGLIKAQIAQNTSDAGNFIVRAGSHLIVRKLQA
jgi:hypothetical protein